MAEHLFGANSPPFMPFVHYNYTQIQDSAETIPISLLDRRNQGAVRHQNDYEIEEDRFFEADYDPDYYDGDYYCKTYFSHKYEKLRSRENDPINIKPNTRRRKTFPPKPLPELPNKLTRTVREYISYDVWRWIFSYCNPTLLASLRAVSKSFKELIDRSEGVWKDARKRDFPEYPEPVLGLREAQMWNLHWGIGCMMCDRAPMTRKCYWAFKVRCCTDCLNKYAIEEAELRERKGFNEEWIWCLNFEIANRWTRWKTRSSIADYSGPHGARRGVLVFWLEDVQSLEASAAKWAPRELILRRSQAYQAKAGELANVRLFEKKLFVDKHREIQQLLDQRCTDIGARISEIGLPIRLPTIHKMGTWIEQCRIPLKLTDRSWVVIGLRFEVELRAAEERVAAKIQAQKLQRVQRILNNETNFLYRPGLCPPIMVAARCPVHVGGLHGPAQYAGMPVPQEQDNSMTDHESSQWAFPDLPADPLTGALGDAFQEGPNWEDDYPYGGGDYQNVYFGYE